MRIFRQPIWSRLGATFGVLAVLALALAAPIHHVHAIERDLARIAHGAYPGPDAAHTGHGGHAQHGAPAKPEAATVHCPLCTLGKMASVLLPPDQPVLHLPRRALAAPLPVESVIAPSRPSPGPAQPRGPPARA